MLFCVNKGKNTEKPENLVFTPLFIHNFITLKRLNGLP